MNREQQLFDQLKQSPTELSLKEVNTIISTFPNLPPTTRGGNLNSLHLVTISIVILSLLLFWNEQELNITDKSKLGTIELGKSVEKHTELLTDQILPTLKEHPFKENAEPGSELINLPKFQHISNTEKSKLVKIELEKPIEVQTKTLTDDLILVTQKEQLFRTTIESNAQPITEGIKPPTSPVLISKLPVKPLTGIIPASNISELSNQFYFRLKKSAYLPSQNTKKRLSTPLKHDKYFKKIVEIKSSDAIQKLEKLEVLLLSYGLNVDIHHRYNEKKHLLENVLLHFKHARGMDFQLIGTGFDRLQINLFLNNSQQIHHFTYRFNEEAYTNPVPLHCKGHKSHEYTQYMTGVTGTTNIDLGN